jgi:hypothetical protein
MALLAKHLTRVLILLATLVAICVTGQPADAQTGSRNVSTQQEQKRISEAPDPATPFLVGAGLITLSVVIRRRRKLGAKKSATAKVNGREDN